MQSALLGQLALFRYDLIQSSSIAKLVNKIEIVSSFEHIEVSNDVLIDLNIGENVYLIDRAFFQFFVLSKLRDWNHFNRVLFLVFVIDSSVDFPINARTYLLVKRVVLDVLRHPDLYYQTDQLRIKNYRNKLAFK